ncbi:hypothetical protein A2154_01905 [Candidatus Gottesmanbacteria bacterium RBG_16_43_7]|uniref:Uncharacterized protein n=1 Tax=Candidatus Gottesmanbacteria bacterium RBG_16_43_7 TaxID=1798373 RepID=A0A1F5Z7Q2_9BACT|nr:MAG: hypothetical protein A2154_01905 [Candidatus Gottesmanbacteria bacterium RBG_16_43_7]
MDFAKQALTYVFLIIPAVFAAVVMFQGVTKYQAGNKEGGVAIGFGLFMLLLVVATYFMFIR